MFHQHNMLSSYHNSNNSRELQVVSASLCAGQTGGTSYLSYCCIGGEREVRRVEWGKGGLKGGGRAGKRIDCAQKWGEFGGTSVATFWSPSQTNTPFLVHVDLCQQYGWCRTQTGRFIPGQGSECSSTLWMPPGAKTTPYDTAAMLLVLLHRYVGSLLGLGCQCCIDFSTDDNNFETFWFLP